MEKILSNVVYSGEKHFYIPQGKRVFLYSDGAVVVNCISSNGELLPFGGADLNKTFTFKSKGAMVIKASPETFWYASFQDVKQTFDPSDPKPVEANIENPPSTIDRMRAMIAEEIMHRYGANSDAVESAEEAFDFDIDGDGDIGLSGYEVVDMVEEEVALDQPPADDPPPAADPPPKDPPADPPGGDPDQGGDPSV